MALQNTDHLLVQRSGSSYKMEASDIIPYLEAEGFGTSSVTVSATAPVSPTAGDMWWNSDDGNLYIYYQDADTTQWVPSNSESGGFVNATVGTNVPTDASQGDLWYSTNDARLYIYDGAVWIDASPASSISDGSITTAKLSDDSVTTAKVIDGAITPAKLDRTYLEQGQTITNAEVDSLNGGPLAGSRNKMTNGDFRVWQRGANYTGVTTGQYTADRWYTQTSTISGNNGDDFRRVTEEAGNALPGLPFAFRVNGSSQCIIHQAVELDYGHSPFTNGTTWTLSWWEAGSTVNIANLSFADNSANNNSTNVVTGAAGAYDTLAGATTVETNGSWTRKASTFTIGTDGTAVNKPCLTLVIGDNASTSLYLTGVQLEPGPVATPFEHRPYGAELALCQRYFTIIDLGTDVSPIHWMFTRGPGSGAPYSIVQFPTRMRGTPSFQELGTPLTYSTNFNFASETNSSLTLNTTLSDYQSTPQRCSGTSGSFLKWAFDAEL